MVFAALAGDAQMVVCDAAKLGHWLDVPVWIAIDIPSLQLAEVNARLAGMLCGLRESQLSLPVRFFGLDKSDFLPMDSKWLFA